MERGIILPTQLISFKIPGDQGQHDTYSMNAQKKQFNDGHISLSNDKLGFLKAIYVSEIFHPYDFIVLTNENRFIRRKKQCLEKNSTLDMQKN